MAVLSGCGKGDAGAKAGSAGELYVYNWGEYIDESVIEEFEKETGIKVVYDMFETNEEMYPVVEAGGVVYDVVCPSDYMIEKMIKNDMLAEIDFNNVPNVKNIDPKYMEMSKAFDPENKYSVPYTWGTVGILYKYFHGKGRYNKLGRPLESQVSGKYPYAGLCKRRFYGG